MDVDEKAKFKSYLKNIFLSIMKLFSTVILLYFTYWIYSISGFSFIQGVDNSNKSYRSNVLTSIVNLDAPSFDSKALPNEILANCSKELVLQEFYLKEREPTEKTGFDIERISVVGSRSSTEEYYPDTDVLAALKKISTKVIKKEQSAFIGEYDAKLQLDGLFVLAPKPGANSKVWQLKVDNQCLRVSRYYQDAGTLILAADYIFELQFSRVANVLKIAPIYLNVSNAFAKSTHDLIDVNVEVNAQWLSDSDNEIKDISVTDKILFRNVTLGESLPVLLSRKESQPNLANWIIAPIYELNDKECITIGKPCYYVAANLHFKFTEFGQGSEALDDIKAFIVSEQ